MWVVTAAFFVGLGFILDEVYGIKSPALFFFLGAFGMMVSIIMREIS